MKISRSATLCLSLLAASSQPVVSFAPPPVTTPAFSSALTMSSSSSTDKYLGLTDELQKLTDAFANIGDDKLRYKQLLYMASHGLEAMPPELKTDDNKVLGCLSTVHVYATPIESKKDDDTTTVIQFQGDSDGLLTKGLVALLVRGLSGNTAEDIQKVDPAFIQTAGIAQSLTPGRNNGFLNMLALMKKKALEAGQQASPIISDDAAATQSTDADDANSSTDDRPMYNGIAEALSKLQPTHFELTDKDGKEQNFTLEIVAEAFEGLNVIKRQQLIYMMLGEIMPQIEGLQIQAQTPEEAA